MPDYYRQLGIYPKATDAQVRRAVRRYWQRVARYRPMREQQAFLTAATVLSNPHLRAVYDPAYQLKPEPARLEANNLRDISSRLRTELQQAQTRAYRLENEMRSLRISLGHALNYPEEVATRRQERRQRWGWLAVALLVWVGYGLLRNLADSRGRSLGGPPYEPVADAASNWLFAHADSTHVYEQAELMPQYPGGAVELSGFLRQQVYNSTSLPRAKQLCATSQVRFVIDSTGRVRGAPQVLGVPTADSAGQLVLRRAVAQLPRFVPGYQQAHPVAVRLTVPLAD